MLIAVLIVVLGLVTLLTFRSDRKGQEMEAERKTALALAQAKEALLGNSATNGIATASKQNPGRMPCPDADNDGDSEGAACASRYVGRFPWKTLRVSDLRDGAAERLWYVVDPTFFDDGKAMNSAVMPTLALNGNPVVAVIIAPGPTLAGQQRDAANQNNLVNYLESYSNTTTINLHQPSAIYNDRIITITARDIFAVVTFRMARELSLTVYSGTMGSTIASITNKPQVWIDNQWDNAVDIGASKIVGSVITLRFYNCSNITYTIAGPGNVTRSAASC